MNIRNIAVMTGILLGGAAATSQAESLSGNQSAETTTINIAGHSVPVVKGGLYDRYRSNPPLSVIAAESPTTDLSWFKELKKEKVDIGFESYSPNFYYKNSSVTAVFTADIDRLRELIPTEVRAKVQPLQVWPGRGLVALTAYAYQYCDNDSYNEVSLSVITNKPGDTNLGPVTMIGQTMSKEFWGYVLKLPVNTELARVRGVVGYNLPKWLTDIRFRENEKTVTYEIVDAETGKPDVTLESAKLNDLSTKPSTVTNSFTNVDHQGQLTYGYAVTRKLSHGSSTSSDSVNLKLGDGSLSTYIKSLKLGKMIRYEYIPEFQSALYAPKQLTSLLGEK